MLLSLTGLSPSSAPFIHRYSARRQICNLPEVPYGLDATSRNPARTTDTAYHVRAVWAVPLSLAATDGIAICFLFLGVLRCFNSPGSPPQPMHSAGDHLGLPGGVSLFGDPRVSLLPTNRGLSQVTTSFIASWCQGIHRTPLIAWPKTLCPSSSEGPFAKPFLACEGRGGWTWIIKYSGTSQQCVARGQLHCRQCVV